MTINHKCRFLGCILVPLTLTIIASAQSILPPVIEWKGKSELLIAKPNDVWITPTEKSAFEITPDYNETMSWFKKLATASPFISIPKTFA